MNELVFIIVLVLLPIWVLWDIYRPSFEIVPLVKHYRIYMWYNVRSETGTIVRRAYKFLFEI